MRFGRRRHWLAFALAATLAACGGGSGEDPRSDGQVATTAEGLWKGTTSTGRSVNGLVLDDGAYWLVYTLPNDPTVIVGAIQGTSTSSGGKLTSNDGRDFNFEGFGATDFSFSGNDIYTLASVSLLAWARSDDKAPVLPSSLSLGDHTDSELSLTFVRLSDQESITLHGAITAMESNEIPEPGTLALPGGALPLLRFVVPRRRRATPLASRVTDVARKSTSKTAHLRPHIDSFKN